MRNIIFVNKGETPPYVLIYDDIQKDKKEHDYSWQFHTAPENIVTIKKDRVLINPIKYSGKTIFANGNGSWNNFVSPGFAMYREKAGTISFKVNIPKAGKYIMWSLGRGRVYKSSEADVLVNGKSYRRFHIGETFDFSWVKFSLNKKRMHAPQMIELNEGENSIKLRGVFSGYEAAKFLLTTNPNFIPQSVNSSTKDAIIFDISNIVSKKNISIQEVKDNSTAKCQVTMIHPAQCQINKDFYQPTKSTLHPRIKFNTKAVNPNFLAMVYPHEGNMEIPKIVSNSKDDLINTTISWSNYNDSILLNLNRKLIKFKNIQTDAEIIFFRFDKNSKLIRLMVTDGKTLQIADEKIIYFPKNKTMIMQ